MLSVIALVPYLIQQLQSTNLVGVIRHNHQVRPAIIKSWGDDSPDFAHMILKILLRLLIQILVYMYHYVVDKHSQPLTLHMKEECLS